MDRAFERLEPCTGKLVGTVLRGEGYRKMSLLPGTNFDIVHTHKK